MRAESVLILLAPLEDPEAGLENIDLWFLHVIFFPL